MLIEKIDLDFVSNQSLNSRRLDLSSLTLGSDAAAQHDWDCSSTDSELARVGGHFLAGCTNAATSTRFPTGLEDVAPFEIEKLNNARAYFGVILFGQTAEAADKFLAYLKDGFWKDIRKMIDWIPVLDSILNFFEAVAACINKAPPTAGKEGEEPLKCDPICLVMAGVGVILDVVPGVALAFKPLGVLFKASRLGKFAFWAGEVAAESAGRAARLMSELAQEAVTSGARGFEAIKTKLAEVFGEGWKLLNRCIAKCSSKADSVLVRLQKVWNEARNASAKKIDEFLDFANRKGFSPLCAINYASGYLGATATGFSLGFVGTLFMGLSEDGSAPRAVSTRRNAKKDCAELRGKTLSDPKSKVHYAGIDAKELDELTPHHLVPIELKDSGKCGTPNLCDEMRQWLKDAKIDVNDGCNGVLLPDSGKFPDRANFQSFAQKYPDAFNHTNVHRQVYYQQLHDVLFQVVDVFANTLDFKNKLCDALQKSALQMLSGTFPTPSIASTFPKYFHP